jgi:hypothetical protein
MKVSQFPLDRRLGGPQSQSWRYDEEKNMPCRDSNHGRPPRSLVTITITEKQT